MKRVNLLLAFLIMGTVAFAQSGEKKEAKIPVIKQEIIKKASKDVEISKEATTQKGAKGKGISISSAARKGSLMKGKARIGSQVANKGNKGPKEAQTIRPIQPGNPAQVKRPATVVPHAKPTPPVVRPNSPAHNKPNRPSGPPRGVPRGGK